MERLLQVAVPLTAATVVVPLRLPPPGWLPIARLMLALELTRLVPASSSCTVTVAYTTRLGAVVVGCCRKARWVAAPTTMLKALEVAPARVPLEAARV